MGERLTLTLKGEPERGTLDQAVRVVTSGGVLLYPTDTIYGLGCNAFSADSIRRIFGMKGRAEKNPAIILADNRLMVLSLVHEISPAARRLMESFWPGPLTLVFAGRGELDPRITGESGAVAIRVPASKFCLALISRSGFPIVSTSANISGQPPLRDIGQLASTFGGLVDHFVDAGPLPDSPPSTIVDVSTGTPRILREGAVPAAKVNEALASI